MMREKQAEIAEKHGIMLDATSRLERGIYARPVGMEEIYEAKAAARRPQEIALTEQERAMAEAQMTAFSKDYKSMADFLDRMDQRVMGSAVRVMAEAMGRGEPWLGPNDIGQVENTRFEIQQSADVQMEVETAEGNGALQPCTGGRNADILCILHQGQEWAGYRSSQPILLP